MFIFILLIIALVSVLLALAALKKQTKMDEVQDAKRNLKKNKIIFQRDKK